MSGHCPGCGVYHEEDDARSCAKCATRMPPFELAPQHNKGNTMKYRKKPVVIEAVQFDPSGPHKVHLPLGVGGISAAGADNWGYEGCEFYVDTLEGRMTVRPGDWIITGIKGERYPCKPDIFAATYEAVNP